MCGQRLASWGRSALLPTTDPAFPKTCAARSCNGSYGWTAAAARRAAASALPWPRPSPTFTAPRLRSRTTDRACASGSVLPSAAMARTRRFLPNSAQNRGLLVGLAPFQSRMIGADLKALIVRSGDREVGAPAEQVVELLRACAVDVARFGEIVLSAVPPAASRMRPTWQRMGPPCT